MSLVINLKIFVSNIHALQFAAVYRGSSLHRLRLGRYVAGSSMPQHYRVHSRFVESRAL